MYVDHFKITVNGETYSIYGIFDKNKNKNGVYHKAVLGSYLYKMNYFGNINESFMFENVIKGLLKEIFKKDIIDFSNSEDGKRITIYPENLNEILNKISKRDESNTDLIYKGE